MGASQMFDTMERAAISRRPSGTGNPDIPWSSAWVAERTSASFRQLDYWIRQGLLGERLIGLGSGQQRRFTADDVEVVHALAALAALGCDARHLELAAASVRARRVDATGEWLVVTLRGTCHRFSLAVGPQVTDPAWVVSLVPCVIAPSDSTATPRPGSDRGVA